MVEIIVLTGKNDGYPDRGSHFDFKIENINYCPLNPMQWVLIRIVSMRRF